MKQIAANNMSWSDQIKHLYYPTLAERLGYSGQDILVIVNIDDVGLHQAVTDASFKALKFGMVKTGSIMVPAPNFEQAIKLCVTAFYHKISGPVLIILPLFILMGYLASGGGISLSSTWSRSV